MLLSTSQLIKKYGLDAKKSLGQNFILDKNVTDKIARAAGNLTDCEVLEIGPGPGGLTRSILDAGAKKLTVIEKDERCLEALAELQEFYGDRLCIINADALEIDEEEIFFGEENERNSAENLTNSRENFAAKKIKIIANLPYNIGTPLLIKWLKIAPRISSMTLMLQKEVVERIVAKPSGKHFGRLAVMVNHLCESKMLFTVSPSVFVPPPKVTSAIVQVSPFVTPPSNVNFKKLETLVAAAFSQRRKMIKSALKNFPFTNCDTISALKKVGIAEDLRAENITIEQFCALAKIS